MQLEPKLDYLLKFQKQTVQYCWIHTDDTIQPIYLRTNLKEESGEPGGCTGIEMYYSFTEPNPDHTNAQGFRLGEV
jgi:hypothetical protein